MILVRSILFNILFYLNLLVYLIAAIPSYFLPYRVLVAVAKSWGRSNLRLLRLVCGIDLFVFGPFYLAAIYALVRRREWLRLPGLAYVTAMLYSLVVYFGVELIEERGRADVLMVVVVNVPYGLAALALAWRLRRAPLFTGS